MRHRGARSLAHIRCVCVGGQLSPTDQHLTGSCDFFGNDLFAMRTLSNVGGQKNIADAVVAWFWQRLVKDLLGDVLQHSVG